MSNKQYSAQTKKVSIRKGKPPMKFIDMDLVLTNTDSTDAWFIFPSTHGNLESLPHETKMISIRKLKNLGQHIHLYMDNRIFFAFKVEGNKKRSLSKLEQQYKGTDSPQNGVVFVTETIEINKETIEQLIGTYEVLETPITDEEYSKSHAFDEVAKVDLGEPILLNYNITIQ